MGKLSFSIACLAAFAVASADQAQAQEVVRGHCLGRVQARTTLQFYGYAPYGTGIVVGEAGVADVVPARDFPTYSAPSNVPYSRYSGLYPPFPTESGYYTRSYLFQRR